MTSIERMKP